ncbi:uncharacterized protein LOC115242795 [Formica exsecta]|uniref:uncharacterized protein LOC115242795 n=1 Tax=Formica exsecta TaxID=72781 RepID=UPI001143495D|nr:uncharacterized protein LOC115242795 [Formica exsecta]
MINPRYSTDLKHYRVSRGLRCNSNCLAALSLKGRGVGVLGVLSLKGLTLLNSLKAVPYFHVFTGSWQLIIKSINVPDIIKVSNDYIILDCDYDLENTSSKGLVVKWFFNTNQVVYQWIYGRHPLADEPAAKYVDLTYKASDDPYTEYRAMKLNKPGIDLTGEYTCVISTFEDERTANALMVVYSTEEKFDLVYTRKAVNNKNGVEITCLAEGLYPQPTLDISIE